MKRNQIKKSVWYISIGALMALLINYAVLEEILIPDRCYYHVNEPTKLFDIFYSFPAYNGGHPVPSIFNFICTAFTGAIIGLMNYELIRYLKSKIKMLVS
ncbi:hypothetical protein [uncultured Aquimarina sp.]|uniref:hypothetical protein n=1 Tax=uncultured Aquimarina sp. TaxID=575652 RepID=UPI00261F3F3D|nr:hypothetical protein [uncultured Aquimarina sp.]